MPKKKVSLANKKVVSRKKDNLLNPEVLLTSENQTNKLPREEVVVADLRETVEDSLSGHNELVALMRKEAEEQAMIQWLQNKNENRLTAINQTVQFSKPSAHVLDLRKNQASSPRHRQRKVQAPVNQLRQHKTIFNTPNQAIKRIKLPLDKASSWGLKINLAAPQSLLWENKKYRRPVNPLIIKPGYPTVNKGREKDRWSNSGGSLTVNKLNDWGRTIKLRAQSAPQQFKNVLRGLIPAPPYTKYRAVIIFAVVAMFAILPFKAFDAYRGLKNKEGLVLGATTEAFYYLNSGKSAITLFDLTAAVDQFDKAAKSFSVAEKSLSEINFLVAGLIKLLPQKGQEFTTAEALIQLGDNISHSGKYLALAVSSAEDKSQPDLLVRISNLNNNLRKALPYIATANKNLGKINDAFIPPENLDTWQKLKTGLPVLKSSLDKILLLTDSSLDILGSKEKKRYIIINQNSAEIRPSGGFIGSLVELDIDQGKITRMEVPAGGAYDFNGSLLLNLVPPRPMQFIVDRWEIQDSNWFFNFTDSAEKFLDFYYHSGGPTVDGVIALNDTLLVDILELTGPIELPEYGVTVTSDNFIDLTREIIDQNKEDRPKQIIADLTPKVVEKLMEIDAGGFFRLLTILNSALEKKDIQIYFTDDKMERISRNFGWSGEVPPLPEEVDYLAVVHANIGGSKSDRVIDEQMFLETIIGDDGSVINKLTITRRHNGVGEERLVVNRANFDYLKVFVPLGSTLIAATGFTPLTEDKFLIPPLEYENDKYLKNHEINGYTDMATGTDVHEESGRTVFGNWLNLLPGEKVTATIEYRLPFTLQSTENSHQAGILLTDQLDETDWSDKILYSFMVQKQSGKEVNFNHSVSYPDGWSVGQNYPAGNGVQIFDRNKNDRFEWRGVVAKDEIFGLIFETF